MNKTITDPTKVRPGDLVTLTHPASSVTVTAPFVEWSGNVITLGLYSDDPHEVDTFLVSHGAFRFVTATREVPVHEPGTSGTATVEGKAGVEGTWIRSRGGIDWFATHHSETGTGNLSAVEDVTDFVPDEPRPTVSTHELANVAHDVLAGPMYEASHAAMHVAEAITVYLSGHGWTPDTGTTAVEQLATVLAGKFGGPSVAYVDVASEVVAFQRGESR